MLKDTIAIDGGFLQSLHWEKFQKELGRRIVRVVEEENFALMVEHQLPIVGGYFFVPRGPIFPGKNGKIKDIFFQMILAAKENKVGWIRIEPQSEGDLELIKSALAKNANLKSIQIVKSKKNHEPAETLMLDLIQGAEQILAGMKQKTRYNIRLAEKKGVEIFSSRKPKDVQKFFQLTEETAKRDGIVAHPQRYYEKMLDTIPENVLKLYFASYKGKIIASAMVSFYGQVATYLHGASASDYRNVMAPYLLQWQAIKEAQKLGMIKYDFGGTRTEKSPLPRLGQARGKSRLYQSFGGQNSWEGITRFKLGFCPESGVVNFPGCYDIIIDKKRYGLYRVLQWVTDLKKGKI